MKITFIPALNFYLSLFTSFMATHTYCQRIKEVTRYELIEKFNGNEFYTLEVWENGKFSAIYKVNGQSTARPEFDSLIAEAHKNDWLMRRNSKKELRNKQQKDKLNSRVNLSKKIFSKNLHKCLDILSKVESLEIKDYFVFSSATFLQEDFDKFKNYIVPELNSILKKSNEELDIEYLNKLSSRLEDYIIRLEKFFQSSLDNAISLCDETKRLKKLMESIDN